VAFSPNGKFIYVAENVGDRLAVVNAATGEIAQRFPTDHYPYGVALTSDGQVFVSAWGGSTVSQFRVLADGTLAYLGRIEVGRHPSALAARGTKLYVTLAGSDRVAIVDTKLRKIARYLHDAAPGAPTEGSTPNAVAFSSDGRRLLVAEADNNAVAIFDLATGSLLGRVPTDWYPTALAEVDGELLVVSAHQLAGWKSDRVYARTIEWQPARAAIGDNKHATRGVHATRRRGKQLAGETRSAALSAIPPRRLHHQRKSHLRSGARRHEGRRWRPEPRLFPRHHD
jgi:DNA-binding beta-propeller fold protein YncE